MPAFLDWASKQWYGTSIIQSRVTRSQLPTSPSPLPLSHPPPPPRFPAQYQCVGQGPTLAPATQQPWVTTGGNGRQHHSSSSISKLVDWPWVGGGGGFGAGGSDVTSERGKGRGPREVSCPLGGPCNRPSIIPAYWRSTTVDSSAALRPASSLLALRPQLMRIFCGSIQDPTMSLYWEE